MASTGADFAAQAMWLYPKNLGFIPPERWGHSACHSHGLVYIYGGCCGGLHFSDVLVLNLNTMSWSVVATKGKGPGSRDSHSAVLWGDKMVVFGGTNGSKKLNDLHVLDLGSNEWMQPHCAGNPPSPRESHTAVLIGGDKFVVFGGSGGGVGNYLNDLHLLDLNSMAWSSMDRASKGDKPSPRDSHTASVVGDELFVFGGDSGDQYHGDVHRLDTTTMTWIKMAVRGASPGARAGHAAVTIGHKIYVIGGVGDNKYYNDVWILDTDASSWSKLDVFGLPPQGRFSHTAVFVGYDIVVYGGCGEDERPLREFLVLRLSNHSIPMMKRSDQRYENQWKMLRFRDGNEEKTTIELHSDRRRYTNDTKASNTVQSESEEHSLSVSQHSSQSQSDQEQTMVVRTPPQPKDTHSPNIDTSSERPQPSLIGAELQGKVDGEFDSGYLMTAFINGRPFRGVLFAPVSSLGNPFYRRGGALHQNMTPMRSVEDRETGFGVQPLSNLESELCGRGSVGLAQAASVKRGAIRRKRELEGVVLSLGVPGNGR